MTRALAGALLALFVLTVPAAAADTTVGVGRTAWRTAFALRVSQEQGHSAPIRCLAYEDADGAGASCPLVRPAADKLDVRSQPSCEERHVVVYGAIDAKVARVVVRLVGGRTITATRFDPVAAVDPQMAYWVATFNGLTPIRSVTTVAADGSVLARKRGSVERYCEDEDRARAHHYRIAAVSDPDGRMWRLDGYRPLVRDDGRLQRTLCFDLTQTQRDDPFSQDVSGTCGVTIERSAKALALVGDGMGCRAGINLILYGLARRNVARVVIRSAAGSALAVPHAAPAPLRADGRVWVAALHMPRSGAVIEAQESSGRTIAKDRLAQPGCDGGSFVGPL